MNNVLYLFYGTHSLTVAINSNENHRLNAWLSFACKSSLQLLIHEAYTFYIMKRRERACHAFIKYFVHLKSRYTLHRHTHFHIRGLISALENNKHSSNIEFQNCIGMISHWFSNCFKYSFWFNWISRV